MAWGAPSSADLQHLRKRECGAPAFSQSPPRARLHLRCRLDGLSGPFMRAEPCDTRAEETGQTSQQSGGFGFGFGRVDAGSSHGCCLACSPAQLQVQRLIVQIHFCWNLCVSPVQVTLELGAHPSSPWVDPASTRSREEHRQSIWPQRVCFSGFFSPELTCPDWLFCDLPANQA